MEASQTSIAKSAPEKPSRAESWEIYQRQTSFETGLFLICVFKILSLSSLFGKGTYKSLSSLPGLSIAGSIMSGLFVAAITKTYHRSSKPSISVSS